MGRRRRFRAPAMPTLLGGPVLAWQLVFFAGPLLFLVIVTFWEVRNFRLSPALVLDNWSTALSSATFRRALFYTFQVALTTTALSIALALPAAYTIAFRLPRRVSSLAISFLIVPIFTSYILRVYAWQIVLSPSGIANSILAQYGVSPLPLLGNAFSLQIGLLTITLPITTIILAIAMLGVDRTLLEAAENLGYRRGRVIIHVLLPSIRTGILLAAITVFLLAFGDFVSTVFLRGSRPPTLAVLIVDTVKSGSQWPRASVIGVSMLAILAVLFAASRLLYREDGGARKSR